MSQTGAMAVRDLVADERSPVRTVYWSFVSNAALLRVLVLATATLLAIALFLLVLAVLPSLRAKREEVFTE